MKALTFVKKNFLENTCLYKCFLIVMAFFYTFPFTASVFGGVVKLVLVWGAAIILFDLIKNRECLKRKSYYFLYAFVFFVGLGTLFHFQNAFSRNVVYLLYLVSAAVVPFVVKKEKTKEEAFSELRLITTIVLILTSLVAAASFVIFVISYQGSVDANGAEYILGFVEGRLYGVMGNPNSAAHLSFISIAFSVLGLFLFEKKASKGFAITNLVLQFLVFSVSNSRSALVCILAAGLFFAFFTAKRKIKTSGFVALLLSFVIGFGGAFGIYACVNLANRAMGYLPLGYNTIHYYLTSTGEGSEKEEKPKFKKQETDREFKTEDDSNGRVEIWTAGLGVAKENIVFGVGSENIYDNILPRLSKSTQKNAPGLAANMHNVYLQVLVGNGALALISFLGFFVFLGIKGLISLWKSGDNKEGKVLLALFCTALGLLAENLFDSNIIGFMCFVIVPIFWTVCGYLAHLTEEKE